MTPALFEFAAASEPEGVDFPLRQIPFLTKIEQSLVKESVFRNMP